MRAFYLDDQGPLDASALAREGITTTAIPIAREGIAAAEEPLRALMERGGYVERDEIALAPTTEGLDAMLQRFVGEHFHEEDEVRFVVEGEGIFDIRSRDDRWMRVVVEEGDLIVVPRGRHHRFMLGERRTMRCVRLFQDRKGWVPHYREGAGERPGSGAG
jgi:1,2-dihydroxy-3-keto-5-methylthiopentene dioxygenase